MATMKACFAVFLGCLALCAEAREFKGKNGKVIEAEIVSKSPGKVVLRLEEGKELEIPLSSLSEADQLFVAVWVSPEEKANQLRRVELDAALEVKGFLALPVAMTDGRMVVEVAMDGVAAKLMIDHRNEQPVLSKAAAEKMEIRFKKLEGGGQVLGKYSPKLVGDGMRGMKRLEFLVADLPNLPGNIDGMIGGQTFVDHSARLDYEGKKLWVRVKKGL